MSAPLTMLDKIWSAHSIMTGPQGQTLLYVDRNFVHEGPFYAFEGLDRENRSVRRPNQNFAFVDHYVTTRPRPAEASNLADPDLRRMIGGVEKNAKRHGLRVFGMNDPNQGIMHVVGPEQGLVQPGLVMTASDSHAATYGAFGCYGLGIGASTVEHVFATQTIWQQKPKAMRVRIDGALPLGTSAKDVVLALVRKLDTSGARNHVIEFIGSLISGLSVEQRMTMCNMSVEAGACSTLIAPDEKIFSYLQGRPFAPSGEQWTRACEMWKSLRSDPDASFDREVALTTDDLVPMVTWGVTPADVLPITATVPDPCQEPDGEKRKHLERAIHYMALRPGEPLEAVRVDCVFIGSCTNARLEDLTSVAEIVKGKRAVVPAMIVPGSTVIKREAERLGLDRIFTDAGFEWRQPGCSMCLGVNGDILEPGQRCASTSNRNFENRQGPMSRTHLMSPAMAAAAALTGRLTDVRKIGDRT